MDKKTDRIVSVDKVFDTNRSIVNNNETIGFNNTKNKTKTKNIIFVGIQIVSFFEYGVLTGLCVMEGFSLRLL